MTTILMCPPKFFEISYEINPWMSVKRGAHQALAMQQWQKLYQTILACGATVVLVPPTGGLPDLVFTANAAMRSGRKFYLSRFKHPERQQEYRQFKQWFSQAGYSIIDEPMHFLDAQGQYIGPQFEGAGDALWVGDTLFAAYGFRSDKEIYPTLLPLMGVKKAVLCELVDPHFYHLDTCFCPLNDHQAIWFPPAFSHESQQRMKKAVELFDISAEEERSFACNAVIIGKNAIIPDQCINTRNTLENLGFTVYDCAMSEFIKSGGACKCLTLDLG